MGDVDAEATVRECLAALEAHDSGRMRDLFTEDVVYHNMPIDPAVGIEDAVTFLDGFFGMFTGTTVEILHLAVHGDAVLTERVDTLTLGDRTAPLPVMGTFELRDGRICAWRDYFDMGAVTDLLGG